MGERGKSQVRRALVLDGDPLCSQAQASRTIGIQCGIAALEAALRGRLEAVGLRPEPSAATLLLFDLPRGYALQQLKEMEHPAASIVVLTDNTCAEYCDDVWNLHPAALLHPIQLDDTLVGVVARIEQGERFRDTTARSTLTPAEHAVLHCLARGWENRRIAKELDVEEPSVRNTLTRVYAKLGVSNRVQAALYYWGRTDLME